MCYNTNLSLIFLYCPISVGFDVKIFSVFTLPLQVQNSTDHTNHNIVHNGLDDDDLEIGLLDVGELLNDNMAQREDEW